MKSISKLVSTSVVLLIWTFPLLGQTIRKESFQGRDVVAGEIIVKLKPSSVSTVQTVTAQDSDIASTVQIGRNGAIILRSRSRSTADMVQAYAGRPEIEYAEPNYVWRKTDVPNDPNFGVQWGLQNTGQTIPPGTGQSGSVNADIHAVQAWDTTVGSSGIVVGVLDTGIAYTHPDLIANLWSAPAAFTVSVKGQSITCAQGTHGFNAITATCDPLDDDGHGTHVSGIIGASGNNGIGVTGVSRVSSIVALKFLDSTGSGLTSDAIAAIEFAIQLKNVFGVNFRVLNASWGGSGFSKALLDEINSAGSNDILFVASAGNDSANIDLTPEYPASYSAATLISVAATDNRDLIAGFSNFGLASVNLAAPGVNILSTLPTNVASTGYGFASGTSMAAPMVSGAAALVLASCALATPVLKSLLLATVDPEPSLAGKTSTGGRLNVAQTLSACNSMSSGTFTLTSDLNTHVAGSNGSTDAVISVTSVSGFAGSVGLSASGLPSGVTASFAPASVMGSGSTVMTLTLGPNVVPGLYSFPVTATSGSITRTINVQLLIIARINVGQSIIASLTPSDPKSLERPATFSDFYQIVLPADTSITIDMRSSVFDPFLYLLSASGTVLASDDGSGGGTSARIGPVSLPAGSYMIEATSFTGGAFGTYFFGVNIPTLDSVTPASGQIGTSVNVTLLGNRFVAPAAIGGTFSFVSSNITVVDSHTITATLAITPTDSPGIFGLSVNSGGISNTIPFNLNPTIPVLSSITPAAGVPGSVVAVRITGSGFTSDMTISAGDGIAVSAVASFGSFATATFTIAASASAGVHNVTIMNSVGTSNAVQFMVLNQAPTLTSITPSSGIAGTFFTITIIGTNFVAPLTINGGSGITTPILNVVSPTQASLTLEISLNAALGPRTLTVTSPAGTSNPVTFTVNPVPPVLTSITPNQVGQGSTVDVTLLGSGFNAPMTIDAGPGITVSNVVITNAISAKATLTISSTATLGVRNLTVTTSATTSNPLSLTIVGPFPDLGITETRAPFFGVGYNEDYVVTVTNRGALPTTGPTTLTYDFSTFNFVSASGTGFSCSLTTPTRVTCVNAGIMAPGDQSTITFTVAVGNVGTFGTTATFTLATAGDSNVSNNLITDNTSIAHVPTVSFTPSFTILSSGFQATTGVKVSGGFPHPITGTMTLTFAPGGTNPLDDPAIQFSTGGRQVTFTVPANSTQAVISGNAVVGFQTGTVAGTLTLSGTANAGTVPPPSIVSVVSAIPVQSPVITKVTKDTQSGFAALVTLMSNTRDVTSVTFTFETRPGIKLSCGSVAGCSVAGPSITFDVQSLFNTWYASDVTFGGASTLRVPFSISGSLTGSINVTIRSSAGSSNTQTLPIP
jgi:subtilisin family serine protease